MADRVEYTAEAPAWLGMVAAPQGALTASALDIPVKPPKQWFDDPSLKGLTPLTVNADGRLFGHIASWRGSHIGRLGNVKPPRSKSGYKYFRTGQVETDNGDMVPVGQLTLSGGHASLEASAQDAVKHYDDTNSAFADVAIGEDRHGIWVAGALRPTVDDIKMRDIRASSVSGDWRPIDNALELVAICSVNVPGFPIPRALAAAGEQDDEILVYALVAAGTEDLVMASHESETVQAVKMVISDLEDKVTWLRTAMLAITGGGVLDPDTDYDIVWPDEAIDDSTQAEAEVVAEAEAVTTEAAEAVETEATTASAAPEATLAPEAEPGPDDEDDEPDDEESSEAMQLTLPFEFPDHFDRETLAQEIIAAGDSQTLWNDGLPVHFSCNQVDAVALRLRAKGSVTIDPNARREALVAGAALPDGRLPITNARDLEMAVLVTPEDSPYYEHVTRRASALGLDLTATRKSAITAAMHSLTASSDKFDAQTRRKLAKSGAAMKDGSYPIRNEDDLHNAIQALGRAKDIAKTKAHIMKRARALNLVHLLPEKWKD